MPLVVPGINSGGDSPQATWMNKLMGKKLGERSDEVNFAKQDLPKEHRVVKEGDVVTQDFNPARLNIHVADDGTVKHVDFK